MAIYEKLFAYGDDEERLLRVQYDTTDSTIRIVCEGDLYAVWFKPEYMTDLAIKTNRWIASLPSEEPEPLISDRMGE